MKIRIRTLCTGMASYIPGALNFRRGTGGTVSARYCYSVWLRHLSTAMANGMDRFPGIVAELGPGDSLGVGLAALISGCSRYVALDVVAYANTERNIEVFDELVELFRERAPIPGEEEFPKVKPRLASYAFPSRILDDEHLEAALDPSRLAKIRSSIATPGKADSLVRYIVPWDDEDVIEDESVDYIYSQAVLSCVEDLSATYDAMHRWLKPDGCMSHVVDYTSHGMTRDWNGHWAIPDWTWKIMKGRRPFLINRLPHSRHLAFMRQHGFRLEFQSTTTVDTGLSRDDLQERFRSLDDTDLVTRDSFIFARKPAVAHATMPRGAAINPFPAMSDHALHRKRPSSQS